MACSRKAAVLTIGPVTIIRPKQDDDKVWLIHQAGEAGEFNRDELAKVLEKFFWEKF